MASIGTLNIIRKDAVGAQYDRSFQLAREFGATVFFIAPDSISAVIQGDPNRFDLNELVEIKSKLSEAGLAFEAVRDANGKHVITVDLNKKPIKPIDFLDMDMDANMDQHMSGYIKPSYNPPPHCNP